MNIYLYNIALFILALIAFPKMLYQMLRHNKKFTVWIHAVSVGETKAVAPIVKMIRDNRPDAYIIHSCITETGHAEAKRCMPFVNEFIFLPLDFSWVVRPVVNRYKADLVIISESDFWMNFLRFSKEVGAKIVMVNGKVSEKSFRRFMYFPGYSNAVFDCFDLLCVQNKVYKERFVHIGVPSDKITITGNLKFDLDYPVMSNEEKAALKKQLGIHGDGQLLVLGSTHAPEEESILKILKKVWPLFPKLKVLLVPRHPERFQEVENILKKMGLAYSKFSDTEKGHDSQNPIILMDKMGLLKKCYQVADLAIVGGSFVDHVGGHNILEPSGYGVPVLFGKHMFAQEELVNLTMSYHAGMQLGLDELDKVIVDLLEDSDNRDEMGRKGLRLLGDNKGSSKRTWDALSDLVENKVERKEGITNKVLS
jgi:3-deoxy-D-manno-octulosonic-acid transferase